MTILRSSSPGGRHIAKNLIALWSAGIYECVAILKTTFWGILAALA